MQLEHAVSAFLATYQGRDSSLPARLQWWATQLGPCELADLEVGQIDTALFALAQRGALRNQRGRGLVGTGRQLSVATINRYIAALGTLLKWAAKRRLVPRGWHSPLADVHQEPEHGRREVFLTAEQVRRLVDAARLASWRKLPAAILLAFTTGLRRGALEAMRWVDVDLDAGRALVQRTKSGKPIVAVLTLEVVAELRAIRPAGAAPSDLVFCGKHENRPHNWNGAFDRALADIGAPPGVTWHTLRHSCATHLATRGAGLLQVADLMGHSNLSTTRRYSHLMVADRATMVATHFGAVA